MLKLAIDLDGVVLDTIRAWIAEFHPYLTLDDITQWNVWEISKVKCSKKQFYKELNSLNPKKVPLIGAAYIIIKLLAYEGHEVFFLTAKTQSMESWTRKALKIHELDDIPMTISWEKENFEYDYLLDDSPANYKKVGDRMIIFEQPYNKDVASKFRVKSWEEFYYMIKKLDRTCMNCRERCMVELEEPGQKPHIECTRCGHKVHMP